MSLSESQLEDLAEPHTPRYQYHCRDCPQQERVKYNHPHFQTGHGGKDPNRLRIRCQGSMCQYCLQEPASQEDGVQQ